MSKLEIIPFGKYKGQPVDILAQDRQYCEWLEQQEWFRARYPAIHTVIINNFGEPEETPEHNALQALFVDEDFRKRFLVGVLGDEEEICKPAMRTRDSAIAGFRKRLFDVEAERKEWESSKSLYSSDYRAQQLAEAENGIRKYTEIITGLQQFRPEVKTSAEFEKLGVDVVIHYATISIKEDRLRYALFDAAETCDDISGDIYVECKPSVGDDYPAVLRQISGVSEAYRGRRVLFIGHGGYVGTGATFEQVKAIFHSRRIKIVLLGEL